MKKLLCVAIILFVLLGAAVAEDETVWAICQPYSFINIRSRPSGRSEAIGYIDCGDGVITDGVSKKGFLHIYTSIEGGEGWISKGYVVYEKPVRVGRQMVVTAKGRVNARKTINGKRRCWVKPGTIVTVYWMAEWASTNKGFIKSEYLGECE